MSRFFRHVAVQLMLLRCLARLLPCCSNGLSFQKSSFAAFVRDATSSRLYHSDGSRSTALFQANSEDTNAYAYADHWRALLVAEQREAAAVLRKRRSKWSRRRLEEGGLSIFDACAEPESQLFGEKIVRIYKQGEQTRFGDHFSRGDVLVLTAVGRAMASRQSLPKECCVVDIDKDWMTLAVGPSWPAGLWEARRLPGSYMVRLDRAAPQAPLKAQLSALGLARKGEAGQAAALLVDTFRNCKSDAIRKASYPPSWSNATEVRATLEALHMTKKSSSFRPNQSQEEAIVWALGRRLSIMCGPPGTGKTRVAALLISTALRLFDCELKSPSPPRVLAVAHSNGAADVLLEALLRIGVPAVRVGRPASVSPDVRHRTVTAMADTHPEVVALRQQSRDLTEERHVRSHRTAEIKRCIEEVSQTILTTAPVVVASCIGAHQLLEDGSKVTFPLVVVDEAAQTTEPGLMCALAAAKAQQVILVGDTRQLPPTVASENAEIRDGLGTSPMARLEGMGVEQRTLKTQYRMAPALLEHPSSYFYDGLVQSANGMLAPDPPPLGFPWPVSNTPLAFIQLGGNLEVAHDFGGKSNPIEAALVADIVLGLVHAADLDPREVAVISPYSKQVQRVRVELSARRISDVRVGTVDSFQGQETDMVVFTAVRSNSENELGFLRDPRRLCVALTRAKRGLVMVGDEKVLRTSRHWAALIDSCQKRGCSLNAEDLETVQSAKEVSQKQAVTTFQTNTRNYVGNLCAGEDESLLDESILDRTDKFLGLFDDSGI